MEGVTTHSTVCVCVCTYKRPALLRRSLDGLARQKTGGRLRYSIVVADNDGGQTAKQVVAEFASANDLQVSYCVEAEQNIALARNKALEHAQGEFLAFIDDDEYPAPDWLITHWRALIDHRADGVLGPVRPVFDQPPPDWLVRGGFCERPEYPTGAVLHWRQTRTGNVMFRSEILKGVAGPAFRKEFGNGGEDQDFFRRMMEKGHRFVWCNEAVVYEVVPPERWKRRYLLKRALLRGQNEKLSLSGRGIARSLIAVPLYAALLLVVWAFGQHVFMKYLIRLLDHAGKLLVAAGISVVRGRYLSG